ncbi:hypothetical protein [Alkalihalobacterium bogoriense]|uniref:hypothetical protein n=1 Tax=Alkalihalobacterium bogoriense TaxID=246272 RepID=UPI00047D2B43|nr:hypothetical protein [Alkalihalobacterium bogoriense]
MKTKTKTIISAISYFLLIGFGFFTLATQSLSGIRLVVAYVITFFAIAGALANGKILFGIENDETDE